jgi:hypothetical protein
VTYTNKLTLIFESLVLTIKETVVIYSMMYIVMQQKQALLIELSKTRIFGTKSKHRRFKLYFS